MDSSTALQYPGTTITYLAPSIPVGAIGSAPADTYTTGEYRYGTGGGGGGFSGAYSIVATSINYSIAPTDEIVQGTGGAGGITVTLPTSVGLSGATILIKKVDAGAGPRDVSYNLVADHRRKSHLHPVDAKYQYIWVYSDGANWMIRGAN